MAHKKKNKKKSGFQTWLVPGALVLFLLFGVVFVVRVFLSPDKGVQKKVFQNVTLMKPPPPQEQKEKPPEPEPPKEAPKQSVETPSQAQQEQPQSQQNQPDNQPPPGADLGVEGEGGSGSDGFGLVAKGKGTGRDITLGGGGGGGGGNSLSLMARYGWYNGKIQDELKRKVRRHLDQSGNAPKGKFEARVHIVLDRQGAVVKSRITVSSGNNHIDEAISTSLAGLRISQPPPEGMPSGMTIRLTWQG